MGRDEALALLREREAERLPRGNRNCWPRCWGIIWRRSAGCEGSTREQVAERMGSIKCRVSQIEQGLISGQEVLARYAPLLGRYGRPQVSDASGHGRADCADRRSLASSLPGICPVRR